MYEVTKYLTLKHYQKILEVDLYQKIFKFARIRNPDNYVIVRYFFLSGYLKPG